jgi:hypothetical protein
MSKKILIVGVLDVVGSTNIAMKKGFEYLGCEVTDYNYRTKVAELGLLGMENDLQSSLIGSTFDLIVFCKVNGMHPVFLDDVKEVAPTWYWFMDNMEMANNIHAEAYARNATFASATASDVAERFQSINKRAYHMMEGFDHTVYFYEDLKKIHDVIFIGNATIPRVIEINNLTKAGIEVTIFGSGWPIGMNVNSPVRDDDERTEINQSKVVLNLCHDEVIFSDRVTKALACGAKVISQPCKDLLNIDTEPYKSWVGTYVGSEGFKEACLQISTTSRQEYIATEARSNSSWFMVCRDILAKLEEYNADINGKS